MTDYVIAPHPRCTNPSVTALRAATAPLSGEPRAWEEVCGVCASDCRDADTCVSLTPVRGGVLDAPWLRDCRGGLGAAVRRDQPHPHHPRCIRLASTATRIISLGHSPRTFFYGRTHVIRSPTPGGRGSPPLRWVVAWDDGLRGFAAPTLHQPLSHGALRRDSSPFRGAEGRGQKFAALAHLFTTMQIPTYRTRS